jgi:hypothetical protein
MLGEWGLTILIILAVFASFGLGRLSATMAPKSPVIVKNAASAGVWSGMEPGGMYVASKTGAVYYFPWCSGVDKIAPENRLWFATEKAAVQAGYRPAGNCKGLVNRSNK